MAREIFVGSFSHALGDRKSYVTESADAGRLTSDASDLESAGFRWHHVCPDPADPPLLDQVITTAFAVSERDGAFRGRPLMPPVYCDQESYSDLVAAASQFHGRGPIREALAA